MNLGTEQPILIVEDSEDDFEATSRALKKHGNLQNPIHRCENGQEALDYLFHKGKYEGKNDTPKPGIILLDLNMPGVDGRKVLETVKAEPSLKHIPVVVLTTSKDERDIESCYEIGANTYIKKPVDMDKFFEAIQRLKEYWLNVAIVPKGAK